MVKFAARFPVKRTQPCVQVCAYERHSHGRRPLKYIELPLASRYLSSPVFAALLVIFTQSHGLASVVFGRAASLTTPTITSSFSSLHPIAGRSRLGICSSSFIPGEFRVPALSPTFRHTYHTCIMLHQVMPLRRSLSRSVIRLIRRTLPLVKSRRRSWTTNSKTRVPIDI